MDKQIFDLIRTYFEKMFAFMRDTEIIKEDVFGFSVSIFELTVAVGIVSIFLDLFGFFDTEDYDANTVKDDSINDYPDYD